MSLKAVIVMVVLFAVNAQAQFTPEWYPPTNAPLRKKSELGSWTFAKDVYRDELGKATLERMSVVGLDDPAMLAPPARDPFDSVFIEAIKSNLFAIVPSYLDLTLTNDVGIFYIYSNITASAYSNRFWTPANILTFCDLPEDFFENTPARFMHRGTNELYGWEGVYRVILALDYIEPDPAWQIDALSGGLVTNAFTDPFFISTNDIVCSTMGFVTEVPDEVLEWEPTNTQFLVINESTVGGRIRYVAAADYMLYDEDDFESWVRGWGASYTASVPSIVRPGGNAPYYDVLEDYHPREASDVQSFVRPTAPFESTNGLYYSARKVWGTDPVYYGEVEAVDTNLFFLVARSAGTIVEMSGEIAVINDGLPFGNWQANMAASDVYLSPRSDEDGYIASDYWYGFWGWNIDGGIVGSSLMAPPLTIGGEDGWTSPSGFLHDFCSNDGYMPANTFAGQIDQVAHTQITAIQYMWRYKE